MRVLVMLAVISLIICYITKTAQDQELRLEDPLTTVTFLDLYTLAKQAYLR